MSKISDSFNAVKNTIPENVTLVVISKTKPEGDILEVYNCGHRIFGESKVQELTPKAEKLPDDIQWHLVGHLQRNKVKFVAPFISMIHSVDSLRLLKEINKEAKKSKRIIDCLLQMHIAEEDTKFGLDRSELIELLESPQFKEFQNVRICGLMGMATFTNNTNQVKREFKGLKLLFHEIKDNYFKENEAFKEISMGMSDDYPIGIDEGSTMVRIGSAIFGERHY